MNLLPFGALAPARPRSFIPSGVDLGDWSQIKPLYDALAEKAAGIQDAQALERWLLDWSELGAALDEESSRRYIAMTCHTDLPEAEQAYLHFIENVEPRIKPAQFALEKIYVEHPQRKNLPKARYEVLDRDILNHVSLFRPENVELETEEARLSQQYQKLMGAQTVQFQGREHTLVQMSRYLEEPDRALRQQAWELVSQRRQQDAAQCEDLFQKLLNIRHQIATRAGFPNYRDYAFRQKGRFDYGPADCEAFHDAVEREMVPVARQLQEQRRKQLKVDSLRPWDLGVDPLNRAALKPFANASELLERAGRIFQHVDPALAAHFQEMRDLNLLDLENRKGKAPGGYQSNLSESRHPFIFMNAVGLQRDVETLLHEAGHAFHAQAVRHEDLYSYRNAPIEFCEVASMAMELLGNEFLEEFYSPQDARRARKVHLEGVIGFFPWMATVDAFQHWIYTHPNHSLDERRQAYLGLMDRFGGMVDWSGYPEARANSWHRQLHIFIHPFYYVEYGIAQLGAIQVWVNSRKNRLDAVKSYKQALALGGSRPLPELFAQAGCRFQFDKDFIRPLIQFTRAELEKLDGA